jgi:hypothetical protein
MAKLSRKRLALVVGNATRTRKSALAAIFGERLHEKIDFAVERIE